ncbi:sigma-54 interaction domain-containing protein [Caldalkalibacillus mannanilyticus]|uniref:sigma-54 interaction domain-containing protein n=1 Tax=Caldalkalibacillus mannanilyticus TaxID=1418 RepID=UPI00046A81CA|nr:sigma-54-dependent Fis family transcriptional regulator [Caldalkalibacillus mannanilyticus]
MGQSVVTLEMLQAVLGSIDEGIHVVNAEGETIYYNHVIASLDGLSEEEVMGKHILEVFPSLDTHTSTLLKVIQTGEAIENQPQTYTNLKGKQVDTVNTTLPIYVHRKLVGAVEVAKDISKVKQLSEKLLELQEKVNATQKARKISRAKAKEYYEMDDFITQDPTMNQMKKMIPRIAKTDSPVLVYGETGTGKEIVVQAIHSASGRKKAPFIAQNCAALPATLLESLLFGTTKGSFTGSIDRPGLFELADGGTLFLDEINSMPVELQAKLLRVLQEGVVRRIGSSKTYPVDIKVVAASNEEPWEAVKEGRLRSDLYYRINVVSIFLLPLRERKGDIPYLIDHFLRYYCQRFGREKVQIEPSVLRKMKEYSWPGNVRELEHAIEAALNVAEGDLLQEEVFPESLQRRWVGTLPASPTERTQLSDAGKASREKQSEMPLYSLKERLEREEKSWIQKALEQTSGNIMQAASVLRIPRQTLQYKIKKYKIE